LVIGVEENYISLLKDFYQNSTLSIDLTINKLIMQVTIRWQPTSILFIDHSLQMHITIKIAFNLIIAATLLVTINSIAVVNQQVQVQAQKGLRCCIVIK
jgi:hypothetical protein